jgi:IS30 family transposase
MAQRKLTLEEVRTLINEACQVAGLEQAPPTITRQLKRGTFIHVEYKWYVANRKIANEWWNALHELVKHKKGRHEFTICYNQIGGPLGGFVITYPA